MPASARKKQPEHSPTIRPMRADTSRHHPTSIDVSRSARSMSRAPTTIAVSGTASVSSAFVASSTMRVSDLTAPFAGAAIWRS